MIQNDQPLTEQEGGNKISNKEEKENQIDQEE